MTKELAVFDRRDMLPAIIDEGEWAPRRTVRAPGVTVRLPADGPSLQWRLDAQAARLTSNRYRGQADNDNEDWPLQKLLRTEKNEACLDLAIRYRDLHDTATAPTQLVGREPTDLFEVQNRDRHGKWKGPKVVTGKRANPAMPAQRAAVAGEETKKRAAPVPKAWTGDWPILAAIDAKRELAFLRARLAYVPAILDAFEWSVVDGLTLEEIGKRLGAGSKGAKGEARARIFDGFGIVDRFWRQGVGRKAANDNRPSSSWKPGMPVPAGHYQSTLHPGMVFLKGQAAA
ncbi:hypothetical protein KYK30_14290 [Shinella yambaruensis]|uniref:Uncharacterized protein n=1 Tax=Shinella yambaruensis TaxID=415996 RepID=A0ABQ5ZCI9_9HYPH|nr:hypothetical protein [Shinella yambaruensis]MCJ8024425.1 hypothetical protein [Shinella yambaruensis]MCU7980867.1 hypothetical protein [Shinella yambaruensis]GLR49725.1 hypothetical protein GCM10007923_09300 [Shinella yambaruensis]